MSTRTRTPGGIKHQGIGEQTPADFGWRRFMLSDSRNTHEDPDSNVASYTETAGPLGYTEVTLTDVIATSGTNIKFKAAWVQPLVGPTGQPVDLSKPFVLMTMTEAIAMSGDFGGTQKHRPMFGLAFGDYTSDIDHADHRFLGIGWDQNGSTFPNGVKIGRGTASNYNVSGAANNADTKLIVATFYHGPDTGGSMAAASNTTATFNFYKDSSEGYRRNTNVALLTQALGTLATNAIKSVTQAQIFAYFGSRTDTDGSYDEAVTKFRLWYMVTHDTTGWGGSGT